MHGVVYGGSSDGYIMGWVRIGGFKRYKILCEVKAHKMAVLCMCLKGEVLCSGSADKSIGIWRRGIDGVGVYRVGVISGHEGPVKCLQASDSSVGEWHSSRLYDRKLNGGGGGGGRSEIDGEEVITFEQIQVPNIMEQQLGEAAREGDINKLYELLRSDRRILDRIDEVPFEDTPLNVAAANGCTHFVIEILALKPSFGRKLNPDGFSPLDLALQNGHNETVKRLVKYDSELVRVQGKERFSPLHYGVETDDVDLLAELLLACPTSIKDLTIRGQTAAHIAVINGRTRALNVLLGWLQRTNNMGVLNWKEEAGNTILHLAAYANHVQVLKLLANKVHNNEKNDEGLTAHDIVSQLPEDKREEAEKILRSRKLLPDVASLAEFLSSPEKISEKMVRYQIYMRKGASIDKINALLVVAALIMTTTYQAALSTPSGLTKSESTNPPAILNITTAANHMNPPTLFNLTTTTNATDSRKKDDMEELTRPILFFMFYFCNTVALACSFGIIVSLLQSSRNSIFLQLSLLFLIITYVILVRGQGNNPTATPIILILLVFYFWMYFKIMLARLVEDGIGPMALAHRFGSSYRLQLQRKIVGSVYSKQGGR
ncbi:hypothetical protein LguiA_004816 [Lonicera macranthoides]